MAHEFHVEVAAGDGAVWLRVTGDLDDATAPELRRAVQRAAADGVERLVVDLTACAFLDSGGIRALVALDQAHRPDATVVVLCPPEAPSRLVLDIVGLADTLALVDHPDQVATAEAPPGSTASGEPDAPAPPAA